MKKTELEEAIIADDWKRYHRITHLENLPAPTPPEIPEGYTTELKSPTRAATAHHHRPPVAPSSR